MTRGIHATERGQLVLLRRAIENVVHWNSSGDDRIGNERTMAAPRDRFRAHDRRRLQPGKRQKIIEGLAELPRFHVVGVGAEAGVSPLGVVRITPTPSASAERRQMGVPAPAVDYRALQVWPREVRIPGRSGKGADIYEMCRAFSLQEPEELLERPGGVTDRKNLSGVHAP